MCLGKSGIETRNTNSIIISENFTQQTFKIFIYVTSHGPQQNQVCAYTSYKHIRLFQKLQGNMCLIMKAKIDHTPNRNAFLVARVHDRSVEFIDVVLL